MAERIEPHWVSGVPLPGHSAPAVGVESPFEMLEACHQRVERSLKLLQRLLRYLHDKGHDESARSAARDVLRYFDVAAPLHHQDEELHVFPPLLAGADLSVRMVVQKLMQDHQHMETAWQQARLVLCRVADTPVGAWVPLQPAQVRLLQHFAGLYDQHIADEEGLVYPAARRTLGPTQVAAMAADMGRRRGVPPP